MIVHLLIQCDMFMSMCSHWRCTKLLQSVWYLPITGWQRRFTATSPPKLSSALIQLLHRIGTYIHCMYVGAVPWPLAYKLVSLLVQVICSQRVSLVSVYRILNTFNASISPFTYTVHDSTPDQVSSAQTKECPHSFLLLSFFWWHGPE